MSDIAASVRLTISWPGHHPDWRIMNGLETRRLDHADALPQLATWFESEWPDWYGGSGPGDALADLRNFASGDSLPRGVVAVMGGEIVGIGALKEESIPSHRHLGPWAAAGYVRPELRGRGIGAALLRALEDQARAMGFSHIYCATATAETLMHRSGWDVLEKVPHDGEILTVFSKALE